MKPNQTCVCDRVLDEDDDEADEEIDERGDDMDVKQIDEETDHLEKQSAATSEISVTIHATMRVADEVGNTLKKIEEAEVKV